MKFPASLHTRLVLSHLLVSLVSIIFVASFGGSAILTATRKDVENSLEDLAIASSNAVEGPMKDFVQGNANLDAVERAISRLLTKYPQIEYSLFLPDGMPLLHSGEEPLDPATVEEAPEIQAALNNEIGEGEIIRPNAMGEEMLYIAVKVHQEEQVFGVLRLGIEMQPAMAPARQALALLILVSSLVSVGVGGFGWLLANTVSNPIQNLTQAAAGLASGDLNTRVDPTGPQEIHRLAAAFNLMAGRLGDHMNELRAFVANASHELRTPLTVVKLRTEALRNGAMDEPAVAEQFLAEIESEVDRLGKMVNDLLDLSRMEAGLTPDKRAQINLAAITTEVHETFSIRAARAGIKMNLNIDDDLPKISGNEDQLRRVFYNLLDNAIKYTPNGGEIDILLRTGRRGKTVRILVKDTGQGIASRDLPHIFERFYRVEATRPRYGPSKGSGLGLSIAKTIVEGHDGKMGVSSQIGKGTTFWIELPAEV